MHARKIFVVASTEFGTAIRTKSFLIGILLLPIIMGASILLQTVLAQRADTQARRFVVLDRSGWLFPLIAEAAEARNRGITAHEGGASGPLFVASLADPASLPEDELLLDLSDRVRRKELEAFVEIPADVARPATDDAIQYHSDNPNDDLLRSWLTGQINEHVRSRRFRDAGLDRVLADSLSRPVVVENLGLSSRVAAPGPASDGADAAPRIRSASRIDPVRTLAVPAVLMFVMFFVIMTSAPQLLNSVLEEKMSKISEVLLGSVSPFELMMGKLLGNVGIAMVLATLYVGGAYAVAVYHGYADVISPGLLAALGLFLVLAILFYGSLYMAVGAACSELKDAQSLMMPVMLLSMLPVFVWTAVLRNPASPLSVGMSLFPPATPFLMLMRMALTPAPPAWQVALSVVLTTVTSVAVAWVAGKIFRTGLLMQGKAPSLRELLRWVVSK